MTAAETQTAEQFRLDLEGMTCASCASRIERSLNGLDGVEATVNLATDQAAVRFDPSVVSVADLVGTVEAAGYGAAPESRVTPRPSDESGALRLRLVVAAALTRARRAARDGDAAPVRRLGVGRVRALDAGRPLGGLAVPSRRPPGGAPRRRDDGHADLDRDARRLGLVDGRAARRARRRHVLRGCCRDHDADPARALPRVACRGVARARRSARLLELGAKDVHVLRGRHRGARARRRARGRRPLRRAARREDRNRRRRRLRRLGRRPVDADRRARAGRGRGGRRRSPAPRSTPPAGSSSRRRGSVATPRWRRSPVSSRMRRPARHRSSGSSTASRPSSSRP